MSFTHRNATSQALKRLGFKLCLFAGLIGLCLLAAVALPPPPRLTSYLFSLPDKQTQVRSTLSPKVVLVGGSNLAFGVDSEFLSDHFSRPVVNMGLNAAIPLAYQIRDVEPYLKRGDILVLSAEYSLFESVVYGNDALATILVDIDPDGWQNLSAWQSLHMVNSVGIYLARKIVDAAQQTGNTIVGRRVIESGLEIYNRQSFSDAGDVTIHRRLANRPFEALAPATAADVDPSVVEEVVGLLQRLSDRGVRIINVPPVLAADSYDAQLPLITAIDASFQRSPFAYVFPPQVFRYDESLYFDTPYHLIGTGIQRRMATWSQIQP